MSRFFCSLFPRRSASAVLVSALGLAACQAIAAPPATMSSDAAPTTAPAARSMTEISAELRTTGAGLGKFLAPAVLGNADARAKVKDEALDSFKRMQTLIAEMSGAGPQGKRAADQLGRQFRRFQLIYADPAVAAVVKTEADAGDEKIAAAAKEDLLYASFLTSTGDATAQEKSLSEMEALAKDHPTDIEVTRLLGDMAESGASSPELSKRAITDAAAMPNPMGQMMKARAEADAKTAAFQDKPLVITGKTIDGKDFTTADWKGKVILVDFWATWCGPCREELPRVKKAYADFHEKGFEIVGVSNDYSADKLKDFVAADPAMPWPQLFDADAAKEHRWSDTTRGFGIMGIPTMFLIDKNGVCRSVKARRDFETVIPKLLAE